MHNLAFREFKVDLFSVSETVSSQRPRAGDSDLTTVASLTTEENLVDSETTMTFFGNNFTGLNTWTTIVVGPALVIYVTSSSNS